MPLSANPAARAALTFITTGALMDVWAGVWYWYMYSNPNPSRGMIWWYICTGLLLSGAVLIVIGFMTGRIGREARNADAPPAPPADAQAAANAHAANANAATAANVAGNAPTSGTPVYMVPAPLTGNTAVGAAPVAVPSASGTNQRKA